MGSRGPAPKPHALRVLEGRTGSRYHEPKGQRPQPRPVAPEMPTWLKGEAKACWERIVPELERLDLLTVADREILVGYCVTWAELVAWSRQDAILRAGGARDAQNWLKILKIYAAEFGLSPASRGRLTIPNRQKKGDLDDLLS